MNTVRWEGVTLATPFLPLYLSMIWKHYIDYCNYENSNIFGGKITPSYDSLLIMNIQGDH